MSDQFPLDGFTGSAADRLAGQALKIRDEKRFIRQHEGEAHKGSLVCAICVSFAPSESSTVSGLGWGVLASQKIVALGSGQAC